MLLNLGFKKKKEQAQMPVSEEKKRAEENRKRAEEIRTSLAAIDSKISLMLAQNKTGRISLEDMQRYHKGLQGMMKKLDEQRASVLDTVMIDSMIKQFASQLAEAIQNGNDETAKRLMAGLSYGISRGREEIHIEKPEYIEKTLETRKEILDRYHQIVKFSRQIDEIERSINRQQTQIDKAKKEYAQYYQELKEQRERMPGLQESLDKLQVGQKVAGEVIDFNNKKQNVVDLYKHIQDLIKTRATNEMQRTSCQQAIRRENMLLAKMETMMDEEVFEEIQKSQQRFQQFIYDQIDQIDKMRNMNDQFSKILDAALSSRKMIDMMVKTEDDFERMTLEEKERDAADARGMERIQEEEQLQETENKQKIQTEQTN
mgnify:CR=1 FL=1